MKKIILMAVLTVAFLAFSQSSFEISSIGIGDSYDAALSAAKRNAIEQGFGTYIKSESEVSNYQTVKDIILSKSEGFIKSYEVQEKSEKKGSWEVKITAKIAREELSTEIKRLDEIRKTIGDQSILVFFGDGGDKKNDNNYSAFTEHAIRKINNYFQDRKFRTFDLGQLLEVVKKKYGSIKDIGSESNLKDVADQFNSDIFVRVDILPVITGESFVVKVIAKMYETSTGEFLGADDGYSNKEFCGTVFNNSMIKDKEINRAVEEVMPKIMERGMSQWSRKISEGNMYKYFFNDMPKGASVKKSLNAFLKKNTVKFQNISGTEYEIWYKGSNTDLQDALVDGLKEIYKKDIDYKIERGSVFVYPVK